MVFYDEKRIMQRRKWNKTQNDKKEKSILITPRGGMSNINTDSKIIHSMGIQEVNFCYLNKFYFTGTAYSRTTLAEVFNKSVNTVKDWYFKQNIPKPGFLAYIPENKGSRGTIQKWTQCFLYEEVVIMVYYINITLQTRKRIDKSQTEIITLNREVETFRRTLKGKLENGNESIKCI